MDEQGTLTVGSLFAGIGGFDLGLERTGGFRTVWFCEQDEFCQCVLAKHWPDVPCYPDICELRAGAIEPVDVLCGGFPCQDLSVAGKGAGIDGARSGLWAEYARIVGELRPRYVVVENVPALLARGLWRVLGDLSACGYDAEWDCLPASAFGAPHRRDRLWIVAYPEGEPIGPGLRADGPGGVRRGRPGDSGSTARDVAHAQRGGRPGRTHLVRRDDPAGHASKRSEGPSDATRGGASQGDVGHAEGNGWGSRREGRPDSTGAGQSESELPLQDSDECTLQSWRVGGRAAQAGGPEWWSAEPPVGRVAHGVPNRLDQLAAIGNALVPHIAEWIGERIVSDYAASAACSEANRTASFANTVRST